MGKALQTAIETYILWSVLTIYPVHTCLSLSCYLPGWCKQSETHIHAAHRAIGQFRKRLPSIITVKCGRVKHYVQVSIMTALQLLQ